MSPVASGVRFDVCTVFAVPLTVALTVLPPWNALVASICVGDPVALTVWQVTHVSVARYLPFAGPAAAPAGGSVAGSTGAQSGVLGCTSKGAVAAWTVCETPGTVRR